MNKLRTLVLTLVLLLGTALPNAVSADNGNTTNNSTGATPEVTIGFGNVTNDTLSFTMDTSVDVYSYDVLMSWEMGAVYCNINGSGGLSEEHDLFVSVMYAGCRATGYYYGTQGIYHIPAGSNGTLTSIYYQSNSPEVCMGSATYAVLDANDELEWRNATVDPEECLTYTKYETRDDLWYVLDEDSNDEGDNESEEEDNVDDSLYQFDENLSVLENFENFGDFSILMEALEIAGLVDDLSPSNTPQMGWTIFAPTNDAFEAAGFDIDFFDTEEDIASLQDILLYHVSFGGPYGLALSCPYSLDWMPMANGGYDDPNDYSTWNQTVLVENDCQDIFVNSFTTVIDADNRVYGYEYNGVDGYPYNDQLPQGWPVAEDNGMIQVVDTLLIPAQYRQPDVLFEFGGNADEDDSSSTDVDDENPVNEDQVNETQTDADDETDSQQEENNVEEQEQAPVEWECMDGTLITVDLVDDGKFDCPDGTDEYTPFVEEENSEEMSEEPIVEAGENATQQDSESASPTVDKSEDGGFTNTGGSDETQTETETSSSEDRYIVIGGLLSFIVLLGILLGTVAVSTKEEDTFTSVFEEGGVAMDELLGLLGRSKMLKVMHVLNMHGEGIRFTELKGEVDTSATTLSRRLGELEEFGLVSRTELPTVPMTVVYRLTDAGLSLMPRVEGMFEWALNNGQPDS
ncbi:MAG: winged helix-turn-helix transcriptional regulator [Poseidonia sp.]